MRMKRDIQQSSQSRAKTLGTPAIGAGSRTPLWMMRSWPSRSVTASSHWQERGLRM
jgi:hypothetical protein